MRIWFFLTGFLLTSFLPAQTTGLFFKKMNESDIALPDAAERKLIPNRYHVVQLDYAGIKEYLKTAPQEFTAEARQQRCVIALPMADGSFEDFSVWQTAMMEPALAEQVPFARTFAGQSLQNPRKTVRISYTLRGFRAMVMYPDFDVDYVEPYAWKQDKYYMVYNRKDIPDSERLDAPIAWQPNPSINEEGLHPFTPSVASRGTLIEPVTLKIYRFAVATTGEYGQDHGNTIQEVFSAVLEHTNMVSGIYERDMDIRLQLIQGSLFVMYFNPVVDPFNGTTVEEWASQNPQAMAAAGIPLGAFDIGHVFARYMGGNQGIGGLGVICTDNKSGGCSAGFGAYGDRFISLVGQEVGHQMGGGHTWNRCGQGTGRAGGTAFEPGSGSTIMSYAGGCGSDNVQGFSDLYLHSGSIEEITRFVALEGGSKCGTKTVTDNTAPKVTLPYQDNFFIPHSTPFELNGSATDPDGDPLAYSWEEMDTGPEVPLQEQQASSPIFRTRPAVPETNRYFPRLTTVLNNDIDYTEQLPGPWTRDLNFRLTARDNRPGGGGVGWADVAFKTWEGAGPFLVISPNKTTDTWRVGELVNVTWDVSNTDKAPVNCKQVNIRLSIDGGFTYPITLAANAGNDGSQYVLVPDVPTTKARVRIDGAGSVFYDISNQNFNIQAPVQPSLTLGLNNENGVLCLPANHTVEVITTGVLGYNTPIDLDIVGSLPADVTAAWSATTIAPGESATLALDFSKVAVSDVFKITVRASSGTEVFLRDIVLSTIRNDFSGLALVSPPNGATELTLTQTLRWNKGLDALFYDVQLASSPSFAPGTVLLERNNTALDSFKMSLFLSKGTPYFWRVRPVNACGAHDWSEPFFFSTLAENCVKRFANDLPKGMTANGTPTIESKITVNSGGPIKNMEVSQIKGYHEFFKDLDVHLISPKGTDVTLWSGKCANFNGFFNFRLNDEAPGAFTCPPPNNGLAYRPQNPLAPFVGENSTGTWILRVRDTEFGGGGAFEGFGLEFCSEITLAPPYLVNNNPLLIEPGNNKFITSDLLLVEDPNNTHAQLVFTLLTLPKHGLLTRTGAGTLQPGAQFTQADIDNGTLRYYDYGTNSGPDGFHFMVTDGEGGFFGTPRFVIQPQVFVGADEPGVSGFDFRLFPNPANDAVWIAIDQPAYTEIQVALFNTAGQVLQEALIPTGANRLQLHTSQLPRGMYFVQVRGVMRKVVLK